MVSRGSMEVPQIIQVMVDHMDQLDHDLVLFHNHGDLL